MEGQTYSLAFRKKYPKFNGLIWAYHWLQIGLYEPLLAGRNKEERQTGVLATVTRFRQMIENPPSNMPRMMPMTPAVAPLFTARYPEAAIIFDNLHSMHDVISDILANPGVPRDQKRAQIMLAAGRYRDNVSFAMTPEDWRSMAHGMGIQNMGGPVRGFLAGFPQPTVERGAVVSHGQMAGMSGGTSPSGANPSGMAGMDHSKMPGMTPAAAVSPQAQQGQTMQGMDHSAMAPANVTTSDMSMDTTASLASEMMAMHNAMMADPVIRARVESNPAMKRMLDHVKRTMAASKTRTTRRPTARSTRTPTRRTSTKPAARTTAKPRANAPAKVPAKPAAKKPAPKKDPMAGMDHSKMNMPKK